MLTVCRDEILEAYRQAGNEGAEKVVVVDVMSCACGDATDADGLDTPGQLLLRACNVVWWSLMNLQRLLSVTSWRTKPLMPTDRS